MSYSELAYEVISKFVQPEDIPAENLKDILDRSFATFRSKRKISYCCAFMPYSDSFFLFVTIVCMYRGYTIP